MPHNKSHITQEGKTARNANEERVVLEDSSVAKIARLLGGEAVKQMPSKESAITSALRNQLTSGVTAKPTPVDPETIPGTAEQQALMLGRPLTTSETMEYEALRAREENKPTFFDQARNVLKATSGLFVSSFKKMELVDPRVSFF